MKNCDSNESLLSGYLDGELTQVDRQRVELHMEACDRCRECYQQMVEMRSRIGKLPSSEMSSEEWEKIMNTVSVKTSRSLGWLLYAGGLVVLIGYAVIEFAKDDKVDALIKTSVAAVLIGMLLLFVSVLRQRMIALKTDKYRNVKI